MVEHETLQPDYGTGQKTLGIYVLGLVICSLLTILAFWVVMTGNYSKEETFLVIYVCAFIQFFVQLICFLRLNMQTVQGRNNVISITFTGVILASILLGTLWIMYNLSYNMG